MGLEIGNFSEGGGGKVRDFFKEGKNIQIYPEGITVTCDTIMKGKAPTYLRAYIKSGMPICGQKYLKLVVNVGWGSVSSTVNAHQTLLPVKCFIPLVVFYPVLIHIHQQYV